MQDGTRAHPVSEMLYVYGKLDLKLQGRKYLTLIDIDNLIFNFNDRIIKTMIEN